MVWYGQFGNHALRADEALDAESEKVGVVSGSILASVAKKYNGYPPFRPVVTDGQTSFTLPTLPTDVHSLYVEVNGQRFNGSSFVLSGVVLTWAGEFKLAATDEVLIVYF